MPLAPSKLIVLVFCIISFIFSANNAFCIDPSSGVYRSVRITYKDGSEAIGYIWHSYFQEKEYSLPFPDIALKKYQIQIRKDFHSIKYPKKLYASTPEETTPWVKMSDANIEEIDPITLKWDKVVDYFYSPVLSKKNIDLLNREPIAVFYIDSGAACPQDSYLISFNPDFGEEELKQLWEEHFKKISGMSLNQKGNKASELEKLGIIALHLLSGC